MLPCLHFFQPTRLFGTQEYLILGENLLMTSFYSIIQGPHYQFGCTLMLYSCWEIIVKPLKIQKSSLEIIGLMSAFFAFMALGVKFLQSPKFLCQNSPHKAKKNDKISINEAVAYAML